MADVVTLGDVSTADTGSGSQLKTGGRRKHNMAGKCKTGQTRNKSGKCVSVKATTISKGRKKYLIGVRDKRKRMFQDKLRAKGNRVKNNG